MKTIGLNQGPCNTWEKIVILFWWWEFYFFPEPLIFPTDNNLWQHFWPKWQNICNSLIKLPKKHTYFKNIFQYPQCGKTKNLPALEKISWNQWSVKMTYFHNSWCCDFVRTFGRHGFLSQTYNVKKINDIIITSNDIFILVLVSLNILNDR